MLKYFSSRSSSFLSLHNNLNSPLFIIPSRYKAKKWPADAVQLYASEYQHSSPVDHMCYQIRRLKYARQGLVAPRANDYDSEDFDITESLQKYLPDYFNQESFLKEFQEKFSESYRDYRREQNIAKDDPRSPFYFSDDEKAKESAIENAAEATFSKLDQKLVRKLSGQILSLHKHKIVTDVNPPVYDKPAASLLSNFIPEPDPVNFPEWEIPSIDIPLQPVQDGGSVMDSLSPRLPKLRESKINEQGETVASGRRKNAIGVATIKRGTGKLTINGKSLVDYFPMIEARDVLLTPLLVTESLLSYDIKIQVRGGGKNGQAGAARLAIAKALEKYDPSYRYVLKRTGLLTRDSRMVERKKPGRPKARKGFQWVKR